MRGLFNRKSNNRTLLLWRKPERINMKYQIRFNQCLEVEAKNEDSAEQKAMQIWANDPELSSPDNMEIEVEELDN